MITPIRGRKLLSSPSPSSPGFPIRNDNPDKGTEAVLKTYYLQALLQVIRNDNPDKGTEAAAAAVASNPVIRLEMITPIRGRKGYYMIS